MNYLKKALIALTLFIALIVIFAGAGTYYVVENRNDLAKDLIEENLSASLGVAVSVDKVAISLEDREIILSDFKIANPDGFDKPFALQFNQIEIELDEMSRDLIVIEEVDIDGARVNYIAQNGGSNLRIIQKNVENNKKPATSKTSYKAPKFILERFELTNAKITPEMKIALGQGIDTKINLSDIKLSNIGAAENGVDYQVILQEVLGTLNSRVRTAVARAGFFEGLTSVALMSVTGGIPIFGVADEILGLVGLGGDDGKKEEAKPYENQYYDDKPRFNN